MKSSWVNKTTSHHRIHQPNGGLCGEYPCNRPVFGNLSSTLLLFYRGGSTKAASKPFSRQKEHVAPCGSVSVSGACLSTLCPSPVVFLWFALDRIRSSKKDEPRIATNPRRASLVLHHFPSADSDSTRRSCLEETCLPDLPRPSRSVSCGRAGSHIVKYICFFPSASLFCEPRKGCANLSIQPNPPSNTPQPHPPNPPPNPTLPAAKSRAVPCRAHCPFRGHGDPAAPAEGRPAWCSPKPDARRSFAHGLRVESPTPQVLPIENRAPGRLGVCWLPPLGTAMVHSEGVTLRRGGSVRLAQNVLICVLPYPEFGEFRASGGQNLSQQN